MNWFDEIRLGSLPDGAAGMAAKVRLTFGNSYSGTKADTDDVFGNGWAARAEYLRRAGIMSVSIGIDTVRMTVTASGDKRRDRIREAMKIWRNKKKAQHEKRH